MWKLERKEKKKVGEDLIKEGKSVEETEGEENIRGNTRE